MKQPWILPNKHLHPAARSAILKIEKEQQPTRGWPHKITEMPPDTAKYTRVVFLCLYPGLRKTLLTNQNDKGQQCQNEHSKRHKVFEIKVIIVHQHHLPSVCKMKGQRPCSTRLFLITSEHTVLHLTTIISTDFPFLCLTHYYTHPINNHCLNCWI